MADPRRAVVIALVAVLVVVGVIVGPHRAGAGGPLAATPEASRTVAIDQVQQAAQVATWSCGGATSGPGSSLPGVLVLTNSGPTPVRASGRLVSSDGHSQVLPMSVTGHSTSGYSESVAGAAPGAWVAAFVTVDGGLVSVSQEISSRWGQAVQPCASSASASWYFPYGLDLRNANEYLTLVNPYPVAAIADLTFTTNQGLEEPGPLQGTVVPARGMTVVGLSSTLARRTHIAASVQVRGAGQIVAFETELVTKAPKKVPFVSQVTGQAVLTAAARGSGVTLTLGAAAPSITQWWPQGGQGPGLTESYDIYNPGSHTALAELHLYNASAGSPGGVVVGSRSVKLPAGSWAQVTTNGQPWSIPGSSYAAALVSTNGVPLVAERSLTATNPAGERGYGALLGMTGSATQWQLVPRPVPTAGSQSASSLTAHIEVVNPGSAMAVVHIGLSGTAPLELGPDQRASVVVPKEAAGLGTEVTSSAPVLVEEQFAGVLPQHGVALVPALAVTAGP